MLSSEAKQDFNLCAKSAKNTITLAKCVSTVLKVRDNTITNDFFKQKVYKNRLARYKKKGAEENIVIDEKYQKRKKRKVDYKVIQHYSKPKCVVPESVKSYLKLQEYTSKINETMSLIQNITQENEM